MLQVPDVAGVNNVKAAVAHDDGLAKRLCFAHQARSLIDRNYF
jgi:hypothetical protein